MTEKKLTLCGHDVTMIYCAATEDGFERISQKSIAVFVPKFGKNDNGEDIIVEPAKATIGDMMLLGLAGIIAYCTRENIDVPISSNDLLFNITAKERNQLIDAVVELRNEWYEVPKVVADDIAEERQKQESDADGDNADQEPKN